MGRPDPGLVISGFVGLLLLVAAVAAVGVLASASTASQALAALVTILGGLVLWFVGSATAGSSTARLLGAFSLSERMRTFASGGIDRADVIFFAGVTVVCVIVAALVVRPRVLPAIIRRYSSAHPVVRGLPPTYFPGAQEVVVDESVREPGLTVSRLADTSEISYLETEPLEPSFDPGVDSGGPITIAAAGQSRVEGDDAVARTRVVLVGDVGFATDTFAGAAANARLLSQAIGWLALDGDLIPLSSNLPEDRPLELTDARVAYARFLGVGATPGLLLLSGAIVWAIRRRR